MYEFLFVCGLIPCVSLSLYAEDRLLKYYNELNVQKTEIIKIKRFSFLFFYYKRSEKLIVKRIYTRTIFFYVINSCAFVLLALHFITGLDPFFVASVAMFYANITVLIKKTKSFTQEEQNIINEEYRRRNNGYYDVPDALRGKLNRYMSTNAHGYKISEFFSWEEFCEILRITTYAHAVSYSGTEYRIKIGTECSYFYTKGFDKVKKFRERYQNSHELTENAKIEGKTLKELWNELVIC